MGGYAARKSKEMLDKMAFIVGVEFMHCLQAVDLIGKRPSKKLAEIYEKGWKYISFLEEDNYFGWEIPIAKELVLKGLDSI